MQTLLPAPARVIEYLCKHIGHSHSPLSLSPSPSPHMTIYDYIYTHAHTCIYTYFKQKD